ncbi:MULTISPECIES: cyclodeaminase/cyclohydrolase family protein [Clostridium]|uniref:Formimidoyltetrahydrofolate cyclodeaminase n=1 Tax=Clostridium cadaveris TaxID=1529 RepID=A0A1I2JI52_9CLOT|nr:cyclodeaminase/cyclohydrolase family protein [Clostridium cadaveris]MDU4953355.1 cyclodeaminase/cyclohydrolase family protein [Clostridium sp.]MDM8313620.1 cyclodeaminase/cyclohydrolase family protein [Clostridium cadaveris]MDY4949050.1 cyclodeaminase/cyclohydrolase family protein [Clostridium cadaveris]NME65443.1 cyclodeaminase/cyclohydrolase family protein [Clostridium cadaveris]NWK10554.1 cyclodeaminase/cyclohydrolase family protein [Clostridium cadaveris]
MLRDKTVKEFIYETSSESPAPGGGSIAALSAASSAALIEMVANLTIGKKGYEDVREEMENVRAKASSYKEKFINYIDEDSDSFNKIMAAFKMPKDTEKEKEERKKEIQAAYKEAAEVPLNVGKNAFQLLELAEKIITRGNHNAVTDGAVAAMSARTAVYSAFYNVKINLGSIKDEEFVKHAKEEINLIESKLDNIEKSILSKVKL